ncbi:uncharacterized protein LOC106404256 [Brassica napus]|uniref:uncharacterized protein LOC106404256 n=1 Tax=Brassica napus TaxID=3708 RepID=UPI00207A5284|nr:uncharacterized protein LOC106404256 [Brassica napus]
MDSNSYRPRSNFVDLLNSQQDTVFGFVQDSVKVSSSQFPVFSSQATEEETPAERKERRTWTPIDDVALISAWIAAYFAASPKVAGSGAREASHCKQRWQKINDQVNKFCGAYEAASSAKRRKLDDCAQSSSSHAFETTTGEDKQATIRPPGVKASKGRGNKKEDLAVNEFQIMWNIKKEDLAVKERLSKMRLLDSLIAKQELAEYEEDLKKKLITKLLSN